jgi:hypothetical protein
MIVHANRNTVWYDIKSVVLDGVFPFMIRKTLTGFIRMKLSHVYFVVYLWVYWLTFIQKLKTSVILSAVQNAGHNYARSNSLVWWLISAWLVIWLTSIKIKILRKILGAPEGWTVLAVWGNAVRVTLWFVNVVRAMQCRTLKLAKPVAFLWEARNADALFGEESSWRTQKRVGRWILMEIFL